MNKILSVIIPSYNMEKYLPKSLGSLVIDDAELLQKLDVIVVNDGSKDRTSEIAHDFESKYPGVFRVIDKPNGHYGSCVNAALPIAVGTYVKILDADDYVVTNAFEKFCRMADLEASKGDEGADLLVSNYQSVDEDGKVLEVIDYRLGNQYEYHTLSNYLPPRKRFDVHSVAYRTESVRKMGYRQTEGMNYTDTEWVIEPMTQVRRFLFQEEAMTCYLIGRAGQSMEHAIFAKNFSHISKITEGLVNRYPSFCKICCKEAQDYYHHQVLVMVAMVYRFWFKGYYGHRCVFDIDEFEQAIRDKGDFYIEAEKNTIKALGYKYHYVEEWHRRHSRHTLKYMFFRSLCFFNSYVKILCHGRR